MKNYLILFMILLTFCTDLFAVRLKDIASIKGVRENQLIGYGLVVGLGGTGDKTQTEFTIQSLTSMLAKLGIGVETKNIMVKNVAAVMVTASLPPFARIGSRMDVMVSSIGDAKSLEGGTLVLTPLKAANQRIYAIAQGSILVGGYSAGAGAVSVKKNHLTVGKIPDGGVIEREVKFDFDKMENMTISLSNPDFTTVLRVADRINKTLREEAAKPMDAATIILTIPDKYKESMVAMISAIESLEINPDVIAKVVLNERTGTIVMGENVRISTVAISHGNLNITINETPQVSQPNPMAQGSTVATAQTDIGVKEEGKNEPTLKVVPSGVTIGEVVKALNAIGVSPRDLISIFQSIKAAGALQAKLEII